MKTTFWNATLCMLMTLPLAGYAADSHRQAEVARLGADVMPFSLKATTHIFTKTAQGGTQRVVAKKTSDATQVQLVREHLQQVLRLRSIPRAKCGIEGVDAEMLIAVAVEGIDVAQPHLPCVDGEGLATDAEGPRRGPEARHEPAWVHDNEVGNGVSLN